MEGAFRFMQHDHFFREVAPNVTEMKDEFVFAAPFWILGIAVEWLFLRGYMTDLLLQRNDVLKCVAESNQWAALLPSQ